MKISIKKWIKVATWNWSVEAEFCTICQAEFETPCQKCRDPHLCPPSKIIRQGYLWTLFSLTLLGYLD